MWILRKYISLPSIPCVSFNFMRVSILREWPGVGSEHLRIFLVETNHTGMFPTSICATLLLSVKVSAVDLTGKKSRQKKYDVTTNPTHIQSQLIDHSSPDAMIVNILPNFKERQYAGASGNRFKWIIRNWVQTRLLEMKCAVTNPSATSSSRMRICWTKGNIFKIMWIP